MYFLAKRVSCESMNEGRKRLQARIYWRCLSWFKALKWPSANEIDFGDFLVVYDFKRGEVRAVYPDREARLIASFLPQRQTKSVSEVEGGMSCGEYSLRLGSPLVLSGGAVQLSITLKSALLAETRELVGLSGDLLSALRYKDSLCITPVIEARDVYLNVDCEVGVEDLAILVASLLVFSRFSAQVSELGSEQSS